MKILVPPAAARTHATALHDERLKQRVLFMVDGRATLEQQASMIEVLERTGRWACYLMGDAITLQARDAPGAARIVDWGSVAAPRPPIGEAAAKAAIDGPEVKRRWRPLRHPSMAIPRELITALLLAARWMRQRAAARRHLRSLAPACIVTAQARTETALPIAAAAADLGIPVILVTAGGLYMPDGGAYMRRHDGSYSLDRAADSVAPGVWDNSGSIGWWVGFCRTSYSTRDGVACCIARPTGTSPGSWRAFARAAPGSTGRDSSMPSWCQATMSGASANAPAFPMSGSRRSVIRRFRSSTSAGANANGCGPSSASRRVGPFSSFRPRHCGSTSCSTRRAMSPMWTAC